MGVTLGAAAGKRGASSCIGTQGWEEDSSTGVTDALQTATRSNFV